MKLRCLSVVFVIASIAAAAQNLPHRQYREGETLVYRMTGVNENWQYTIDASGVVRKDASGAFFEDFQWSHMCPAASQSILDRERPLCISD